MTDRPPPSRPVTPYAPFEERPRSITPTSVYAVHEPSPPSQPSVFTKAIQDALDLMEQSISQNVKRTLQALGTAVLAKQEAVRAEVARELAARDRRLAAHAHELETLRGAYEERTGVILPPPPDEL